MVEFRPCATPALTAEAATLLQLKLDCKPVATAMPCVAALAAAPRIAASAYTFPVGAKPPRPAVTPPPIAERATPFQLNESCAPMATPTAWLAMEPTAPPTAPLIARAVVPLTAAP